MGATTKAPPNFATRHLPFEERFALYTQQRGDGCWEWTGSLQKLGYGQIRRDGVVLLAHRVSYEKFVGPIPPGHVVCHRCDNPRCWRPDHLFEGTQADNLRDMVAKNRHARNAPMGSRCHFAKLTENQAVTIRSAAPLDGERKMKFYARLAREFGVSLGAIRDIFGGRRWGHV